jgi:hypothetical protein
MPRQDNGMHSEHGLDPAASSTRQRHACRAWSAQQHSQHNTTETCMLDTRGCAVDGRQCWGCCPLSGTSSPTLVCVLRVGRVCQVKPTCITATAQQSHVCVLVAPLPPPCPPPPTPPVLSEGFYLPLGRQLLSAVAEELPKLPPGVHKAVATQ